MDDGSTDSTPRILRELGGIRHIRIQNSGVSYARNAGAAMATAEWVAFCDADDIWLPGKLEKQLEVADEFPQANSVICDYVPFSGTTREERSHFSYAPPDYWRNAIKGRSGWLIESSIVPSLTRFQPCITSVPIVRKSMFDSFGGFDEKVSRWNGDDTCFHLRYFARPPFAVVPEVLLWYRRHEASFSANELKQLAGTVYIWRYIIRHYPEAAAFKGELDEGLKEMRNETLRSAIYHRNPLVFLKTLLGVR